MIQELEKDLRYGTRTLLRNSGFTATALITLALAIGAVTAIFSVVEAVLLRPLPYHDPQRLVLFFEDLSRVGYARARVSPPTYLDLKEQKRIFQDVAAANETAFNLSGNAGAARQLNGALVTYNPFSVLGVKPLLGRTFSPEEDRPGANHVALLSYALWQNRFGGDPAIIGRALRLNAEPYTVIGIMPQNFFFPEKEVTPIEIWTPRAFTPQELIPRRGRYLLAIGRLQPGVSLGEVNAGLRTLAGQIARQYPNDMRGVSRFFAEPLQESDTHEAKRGLLMLLFAVGFILFIACANIANLLLSRTAARRREIALRAALGASRGRIVRQLLTESILLSIAGALLGVCLAAASFAFTKHLVPADLSHAVSLHFDLPLFGFTILISFASSFIFGLPPAWQAVNADLNEALRDGGRGSSGSRQLLGSTLVAGEIALSLILLAAAGLLLKSLYQLRHVNPGFQATHVLTFDFDMAEAKFRDWNVRTRFEEQVLEQLRALPNVESAGFTGDLPLTSKGWNEEVTPEGAGAWRDAPATVIYGVITPGYLEALKVPLIRGRYFDSRDRNGAPLVTIVNQKAAEDFWPNQNPIGRRLKLGRIGSDHPWLQVVGVTGDVRHAGLSELLREGIYCPYLQASTTLQWQRFLAVRTTGDPMTIVGELRQIVARLDPEEPLNHVRSLSDLVDGETSQTRFQTTLLGGLAALALLMAAIGIYGVMAYLVTQRAQEIGIRMALGAQKSQILALVMKRGMRLVLIGTVAGLSAALILTRLMSTLLFEVSPSDFGVMISAGILLSLTAAFACLIPARRALRLDPILALKCE